MVDGDRSIRLDRESTRTVGAELVGPVVTSSRCAHEIRLPISQYCHSDAANACPGRRAWLADRRGSRCNGWRARTGSRTAGASRSRDRWRRGRDGGGSACWRHGSPPDETCASCARRRRCSELPLPPGQTWWTSTRCRTSLRGSRLTRSRSTVRGAQLRQVSASLRPTSLSHGRSPRRPRGRRRPQPAVRSQRCRFKAVRTTRQGTDQQGTRS